MDLEALRPARSRHALLPATPWFSVEAARHEVALFDDTSQDDLLTDYINFAVERVSAHVGSQLPGVEITDFWPSPMQIMSGAWWSSYGALISAAGVRFELSQASVIAATSIAVSAYLDDDPDTLATVDAADYSIDRTASPPHLVLAKMPDFATPVAAPLQATYTPAGISDDYPMGREQVTQAIRYIVSTMYEHRGAMLPPGWERGLASILGPVKRIRN